MADVLMKDALEAFVNNPNDMFKQLEEMFDRSVERAVATERERCAKLVEDYLPKDWYQVDAQTELAIAIRKGE